MERLSGLDASFLYAESRTMPLHVAFIVICDPSETPGGYSFRKIYDLIDARTQTHPAFRRRLVEVPFQLNHPLWIDDPEFNIMDHVHHVALPKPGTKRDLGRMIGRLMQTPLDRSKPLWEAWIIEGLKGGKFAFVTKIHHAMVDGVSGTGLLMHLLDPEPVVDFPAVEHRSKGEPRPSDAEMIIHGLRSRIGGPKRFFKQIEKTVDGLQAMTEQKKLHRKLHKTAKQRSGPFAAPRTHFNGKTGGNRDVALTEISLSEIKAVKNATGVTVNDVVLGICGGALRRYLKDHGDLPDKSLISMVPVSVRKQTEASNTNNHVSGMWATLATDVSDPLERLKLIHEDTEDAKDKHDAVGADLLQDWAEFSAPSTFNLAVRTVSSLGITEALGPVHNTIISNVPGPRQTLYLAGSKLESMYPLGPVMGGVGLNISLASYEDTVGFCLCVDSDLVHDVGEIAEHIQESFRELKRLSGVSAPRKSTAKKAPAKKAAKKKAATKVTKKAKAS